jgi:hypothetical protein
MSEAPAAEQSVAPAAPTPPADRLFSPGPAPWGVNRIYWEQDQRRAWEQEQKRAAGLLPRGNGAVRGFIAGRGSERE